MFYIDSDNSKHRPIMVHRAILGSIERFMGILIENYAGESWAGHALGAQLVQERGTSRARKVLLRSLSQEGVGISL